MLYIHKTMGFLVESLETVNNTVRYRDLDTKQISFISENAFRQYYDPLMTISSYVSARNVRMKAVFWLIVSVFIVAFNIGMLSMTARSATEGNYIGLTLNLIGLAIWMIVFSKDLAKYRKTEELKHE